MLVLLTALPTIAALLHVRAELSREVTARAEHGVQEMSVLLAWKLRQLADGTHHLLSALEHLTHADDLATGRCDLELAAVQRQHPYYANIAVVGMNGDIVCSALSYSPGVNVADAAYFRRALEVDRMVVGDYRVGLITGLSSIHFARRFMAEDGEVGGVIMAAVNLDRIRQDIAEFAYPHGASAVVLDGNGRVLARYPDDEKLTGKAFRDHPWIGAVLGGTEPRVTEAVGLGGVRRLYSHALAFGERDQAIHVYVGIPPEVAQAAFDRPLRTSLLVVALALVLSALIALRGSDFLILRPMRQVVAAAERLGDGDLSARTELPAAAAGELASLAAAFDRMAARIEAKHRELVSINEELEGRVEQRAGQIEAANRRLSAVISVLPVGVWLIDRAGRVTEANAESRRIWGGEPPQRVPDEAMSVLWADTGEPVRPEEWGAARAFGKGEICLRDELQIERPDGSRVTVLSSAVPIRDEAGAVRGAVVVNQDITEIKRLQVTLARQRDDLDETVRARTTQLEHANEELRRNLAAIEAMDAALRRSNRALRTISQCNHALVRGTEEGPFLEEICRVLTDKGGYVTAWIGLLDDTGNLKVASRSGPPDCRLPEVAAGLSETDGAVPWQQAITARAPHVVHDCAAADVAPAWRDEAVRCRISAAIAVPLIVDGQAIGALSVYSLDGDVFDADEMDILQEFALDAAFGIQAHRTRAERDRILAENLGHQEKLRTTLIDVIAAIAATLEMRDPYTAGHQRRVADLAEAIAAEMGLPKGEVEAIYLAATVHDIGKVHIPNEILSRPGRLSPIEFEMVKSHAAAGYDILKDIAFPWPIARMVHEHHERLDGSGYPRGLKAHDICQGARIIAVADVVEAIASHRPYRAGLGIDAALAEIEDHRGGVYDAAAVDACLRLFRDRNYRLDGERDMPTKRPGRNPQAVP